MKMISFCNKKGGVGKTTLAKNVAYKFALDNKKVLLIDLNPQATLTFELKGNSINLDKTIAECFIINNYNSLKKIIQPNKYKNIDYVVGGEKVRKVNFLLKEFYDNNDKFFITEKIYLSNKNIFDSYDYVLIDYPPTVKELALSFLALPDLIVIPINSGSGSYKGVLDIKNTLNSICRLNNRNLPEIKIVFNNIKDNKNTDNIFQLLKQEKILDIVSNNTVRHSDSFIKTENNFESIWTNQHYWRQKQAYEELIKEIK